MSNIASTTHTLVRHEDDETRIVSLNGEPSGPAGGASVMLDSGLVLEVDLLEPSRIVALRFDRDAIDPIEIATIAGGDAARLVGDSNGTSATVSDTVADARAAIGQLAVLERLRGIPGRQNQAGEWSAEALLVGHEAARHGLEINGYLAAQASAAVGHLLTAIDRFDPDRSAESPLSRAATIAAEHLATDHRDWVELDRLVNDLPDSTWSWADDLTQLDERVFDTAVLTGLRAGRAETERDHRDVLGTYPLIWELVWTDAVPAGEKFDQAVTVVAAGDEIGADDGRIVRVEVAAPAARSGTPSSLVVRIVNVETLDVESMGTLARTTAGYDGELWTAADYGPATHRVEVIRSTSAPILTTADWNREIGRQWSILAYESERLSGDLADASRRWTRAASHFRTAADDRRLRQAEARAAACKNGAPLGPPHHRFLTEARVLAKWKKR